MLVWLAAASRDSALSGYRRAALARSGMVPAEDAETTAARYLSWLAETRRVARRPRQPVRSGGRRRAVAVRAVRAGAGDHAGRRRRGRLAAPAGLPCRPVQRARGADLPHGPAQCGPRAAARRDRRRGRPGLRPARARPGQCRDQRLGRELPRLPRHVRQAPGTDRRGRRRAARAEGGDLDAVGRMRGRADAGRCHPAAARACRAARPPWDTRTGPCQPRRRGLRRRAGSGAPAGSRRRRARQPARSGLLRSTLATPDGLVLVHPAVRAQVLAVTPEQVRADAARAAADALLRLAGRPSSRRSAARCAPARPAWTRRRARRSGPPGPTGCCYGR